MVETLYENVTWEEGHFIARKEADGKNICIPCKGDLADTKLLEALVAEFNRILLAAGMQPVGLRENAQTESNNLQIVDGTDENAEPSFMDENAPSLPLPNTNDYSETFAAFIEKTDSYAESVYDSEKNTLEMTFLREMKELKERKDAYLKQALAEVRMKAKGDALQAAKEKFETLKAEIDAGSDSNDADIEINIDARSDTDDADIEIKIANETE